MLFRQRLEAKSIKKPKVHDNRGLLSEGNSRIARPKLGESPCDDNWSHSFRLAGKVGIAKFCIKTKKQ